MNLQKNNNHKPNDFCGVGIQFKINAESNATLATPNTLLSMRESAKKDAELANQASFFDVP
ncbi:hypothetical protein [Photobacterium indicum]|uniref:hypothetical protein n=1 Tax=Photobacterium indicum TaxID=81447 RepID=UPI003D0DC4A3